MAEFNPQTGQMGSQNYIGYSERRSGNNAWASLFGSVIDGIDQNNQQNIEASVNQTVASLDQQYFGTDDRVAEVTGQQQEQPQQEPTTEPASIPKPVAQATPGCRRSAAPPTAMPLPGEPSPQKTATAASP